MLCLSPPFERHVSSFSFVDSVGLLVVVAGKLFPGTRGDCLASVSKSPLCLLWRGQRTGVGDGNRRRINVAKVVSDRRHDGHGDGTGGADNDGPEEGGTLAGCPAAVLEGGRPEERSGRHDGRLYGKSAGCKRREKGSSYSIDVRLLLPTGDEDHGGGSLDWARSNRRSGKTKPRVSDYSGAGEMPLGGGLSLKGI